MAAAFHHGTETIRIDGGSNPVYTVDGAITAIVGTGMSGPVNEITVCQTAKDFARFGTVTGAGFTLPDAAACSPPGRAAAHRANPAPHHRRAGRAQTPSD